MKPNFEKIFFYFILVLVSGSVGYALKPNIPQDQISYEHQNEACVRAMSMMEGIYRKQYFNHSKKTKKEIALERMQNARY